MKAGTVELLKFKKLQRTLGLKLWECVGILETLWSITAKNAQAGDIGKYSNEEIAAGLDWQRDADELINALVASKWLDVSTDHRLVVHDWHEHAPNYIKGGMSKSRKEFASSDTATLTSTQATTLATTQASSLASTQGDSQDTTQATSHLVKSSLNQALTKPNPAKPSQVFLPPDGEEKKSDDSPELSRPALDRFEQFWKNYPARNGRKEGKQLALKQFAELTVEHQENAIEAAENYRLEQDPQFVKDAFRFLRDKIFLDWLNAKGSEYLVPEGFSYVKYLQEHGGKS